jgi:hypothetical protein
MDEEAKRGGETAGVGALEGGVARRSWDLNLLH